MVKKYRNYTDTDIVEKAKQVFSIAGLLRALNLKEAGGNYINMKRNLQRLNVNTDHWTQEGWSKNQQLKDWSKYTSSTHLKKHLLKERGVQCENCHFTEWLNKPITLELEHVDGDRTNNSLNNLKLLCPNCHSYTLTWRRKKN